MAYTSAQVDVKFTSSGAKNVRSDLSGVDRAIDNVNSRGGFFKEMLSGGLGDVVGGYMTRVTDSVMGLGKSFIMANADMETWMNQLEIATGDAGKAAQIFDEMKTLAAKSPFEFPELIQASQQLESLGFSAEKWMPIIGDTSAATGKSIDQVTQAVMDASTGEFERLKELGIRTQVNGDKIAFSFMKNGEMMTVEAENTQEGIQAALGGIWEDKYEGSMDKLSNTFIGRLATLKDNINMMMIDASKPLFDLAKAGLGWANQWFDKFGELRAAGIPPFKAAMGALSSVVEEAFGPGAAKYVDKFASVLEDVGSAAKKVGGFIGDALGSAFSLLGRNMDIVLPALKGIGLALAAFAGYGFVTAIIGAIVAAIGALLSPIVLVVAAIAALSVAWSKNWGDIQGKTAAVVGFVKTHIDTIINVVAAMTGPIGVAILTIVKHWDELVEAFKAEGLIGALKKFGSLFKVELAGVLSSVMSIVDAIRNVDWGGFLSGAWDAIQTGLEFAWQQLSSIDWSAVIGQAVEVGSRILSWAKETLGSVDWGRILGAVVSVGLKVYEWVKGQLVSIDWGMVLGAAVSVGTKVFDWVKGLLVSIDWGRIFGAAVSVGSKVFGWVKELLVSIDWGQIFGAAVSVGSKVFSWVKELLVSIDWGQIFGAAVSVGSKVFSWVKDLLVSIDWSDLFGSAVSVGSKVFSWVKELLVSIDWSDMVGSSKEVGSSVFSWVKGLLVSIDWSDMVGSVKEVGSSVFSWIKGLLVSISWTDLFGAAIELGTKLLNWITGQITIPAFPDWPSLPSAADVAGWIKDAIFQGYGGEGKWKAGTEEGDYSQDTNLAIYCRDNPDDPACKSGGAGGNRASMGFRGAGGGVAGQDLGFGRDLGGGGGMSGLMGEIDALIAKLGELSPAFDSAKSSTVSFVEQSIGVMGGWSTGLQTMVNTTMDLLKSRSSGATAGSLASFISFVEQTIGLMGGWTVGIQTMINTTMDHMKLRSSGATAGSLASFISFVAQTVAVMGGWSVGIQTIVNTTMDNMKLRSSGATAGSLASFVAFVAQTVGVMGGWSTGINNMVNNTMNNMKSRASGGTSSAKSSFVSFVSQTIGVMGGWSGGITNIVSGAMRNMVSRARSGGSDMASALRNGASDGANGVRDVLGRIPGIVNSIAGQGASAAYNAGASIGAGFANGMRAFLGQIRAAADEMVAAADRAIRARARISSPSKLFADLGEFLGRGFEQGIRNMVPKAARAAADLVKIPKVATPTMQVGVSRGILGDTQPLGGYRNDSARGSRQPAPVVKNYYHTEYIALSASDLKRLTEQAERGGNFAKDRSRPDSMTQYIRGDRR